jgi:hypothetical protein
MLLNGDPIVLAKTRQHDLLAESTRWRRFHQHGIRREPAIRTTLVLLLSMVTSLRSWERVLAHHSMALNRATRWPSETPPVDQREDEIAITDSAPGRSRVALRTHQSPNADAGRTRRPLQARARLDTSCPGRRHSQGGSQAR